MARLLLYSLVAHAWLRETTRRFWSKECSILSHLCLVFQFKHYHFKLSFQLSFEHHPSRHSPFVQEQQMFFWNSLLFILFFLFLTVWWWLLVFKAQLHGVHSCLQPLGWCPSGFPSFKAFKHLFALVSYVVNTRWCKLSFYIRSRNSRWGEK